MLQTEWDDLLLDSEDKLDSPKESTSRGKKQQKQQTKQKDREQFASYKDTTKVTKITSNEYGKEKSHDYISKKNEDNRKEANKVTKETEGKKQDFISKRNVGFQKIELNATMKKTSIEDEDIILMDYDIDEPEYTPATSRPAKFQGKESLYKAPAKNCRRFLS